MADPRAPGRPINQVWARPSAENKLVPVPAEVAGANIYMGVATPSAYETFAGNAILPIHQNLWETLVYPNIRLFLIPVVLAELSMAWLLLKSETYVKAGLGIALAFVLFLFPFWWQGGAIANLILAMPLLWLQRYDYPQAIPEIIRGEGSGQQSTSTGSV
jgi:hypothetical protein